MRGFWQRHFHLQPFVRGAQATTASALPGIQSSSIVLASRWAACCCLTSRPSGRLRRRLTQALGVYRHMAVSFGDNVQVLSNSATDAAGLAGRAGTIYGETVPSASGVSVLGELAKDYAVNVFVDELKQGFWLDPSLVKFLDHGAGAEITIKGSSHKSVRQSDGSWLEVSTARKPWWRFW
jgi:hypothetical protein